MINESNAKKLQNGNESIAKAIDQVSFNKELLLKFGEATARRAMSSALGESGCEHWNARALTWLEEKDHLMVPAEIKSSFQRMAVRGIAHRAGDAVLSYTEMIHGADAAECAISISLRSIEAAGYIKWWDNENSDAESMLWEQEEQLRCIMGLIDAEKDSTVTAAIDDEQADSRRENEIYVPYVGQTGREIAEILQSFYNDAGGDERKFMQSVMNSEDPRLQGTSRMAAEIFFTMLDGKH